MPKNTQIRHFGPKFKGIYFCTKLCNKRNLRALIPNMTTIFSKSSPKIQKSGIFGPKFKNFYFLHETLQQDQFEGADLKYENGFTKLLPKTLK